MILPRPIGGKNYETYRQRVETYEQRVIATKKRHRLWYGYIMKDGVWKQ